MNEKNSRKQIRTLFTVVGLSAAMTIPTVASADDWGFSLNVPFFGVRAHNGHYYYDNNPDHRYHRSYRYRGDNRYYYPRYYNPVEEREVVEEHHRDYDGTHHSETTVEDRHRSFYSPGRNQAITEPETEVYRESGQGYDRTVERTEWIGADGRPHSTTIDRTTTRDRYGNTHTDTRVNLKQKGGDEEDSPKTTSGIKKTK